VAKAPAPMLLMADPFLLATALLPVEPKDVSFEAPVFTRSLNWVTTWRFVQRAAPPSRAPTAAIA